MIKIVLKFKLKPGVKEEYLQVMSELLTKTRQEDGCLAYDLFEDAKDPLTLSLIEEWRDDEALRLHNETEHFTRIVPKLREYRESQELNFYKKLPY